MFHGDCSGVVGNIQADLSPGDNADKPDLAEATGPTRRGLTGRSTLVGKSMSPHPDHVAWVGTCQRGRGRVFSDAGYVCGGAPTAAELGR